MHTAELISEFLPQFCPITNHYRCTDGKTTWYLLITVASAESLGNRLGIPVNILHLPKAVDVFLSDENAVVLDADFDSANGLTPLCRINDCTSHDEALSLMGYEITE
ncbi:MULTISPECIES: DUF7572 family protein [Mycobacteroides]|uniref:DUF7572 domain-containing protein n=1 Tax=Mycobacteroides chelonae TaxID=1774 RepID=A0AB73LQI7_MYCCH|nr:hypothetical protein BKG62_03560 [Mycobacteroides chelonae]OHT58549.1 hypothetical protein BKG64_17820 [Mycobacteroides chelonae]OHT64750.1 hypothetical protein BKG65_08955 [Mycobacteroides chelonae]OHT67514.1 hypothetical protein BKG66_22860 [Mycobacteroides chelonae]OHT69157.1 hypothetical protein BKG67_21405 [Mycobacteroides chelonae]